MVLLPSIPRPPHFKCPTSFSLFPLLFWLKRRHCWSWILAVPSFPPPLRVTLNKISEFCHLREQMCIVVSWALVSLVGLPTFSLHYVCWQLQARWFVCWFRCRSDGGWTYHKADWWQGWGAFWIQFKSIWKTFHSVCLASVVLTKHSYMKTALWPLSLQCMEDLHVLLLIFIRCQTQKSLKCSVGE